MIFFVTMKLIQKRRIYKEQVFMKNNEYIIKMSRKISDTSVLAHTVGSIMERARISRQDAKKLVNANFMLYSRGELPVTFTQWDPDYRM
ncbi:MAG: hypothetical protein AABW93_00870, partial [Nanoarchaeota archaeon]